MRSAFRKLAFLAFALVFATAARPASAGFMGDINFAMSGTTADTGLVVTAHSFNFGTTFNLGADGAFSNAPGVLSASTLVVGSGIPGMLPLGSFTFTVPGEGVFVETGLLATSMTASGRSFNFEGIFTPSSGPFAGTQVVSGLDISFTQAGGLNALISASGTLFVPLVIPSITVPEPASIAMLGLGLVGVCGYSRRRRMASSM